MASWLSYYSFPLDILRSLLCFLASTTLFRANKISESAKQKCQANLNHAEILDIIKDEFIRLLPGNYVDDPNRGEPDPREHALLNIFRFRRLLWAYKIYYNNKRRMRNYPLSKEMILAGVRPYPAEIFRWSIQKQTGQPPSFDREVLQKNLLPDGEATVFQYGIKWRVDIVHTAK